MAAQETHTRSVCPDRPPFVLRRWRALPLASVLVVTVASSAGLVAMSLEERDTFCIGCHTVPETTYYDRAYSRRDDPSRAVRDLATAHYDVARQHEEPAFACIDCHRGDASLGHRLATLALGARDALIFVAGRADPAIEKTSVTEPWLPDAACVRCHGDTLLTLAGLENHFHTSLPQAARVLADGGVLTVPPRLEKRREGLLRAGLETIDVSITCASCHRGHATIGGGAKVRFMETGTRAPVCVSCHRASGRGPQDVADLE